MCSLLLSDEYYENRNVMKITKDIFIMIYLGLFFYQSQDRLVSLLQRTFVSFAAFNSLLNSVVNNVWRWCECDTYFSLCVLSCQHLRIVCVTYFYAYYRPSLLIVCCCKQWHWNTTE